MGQCHVLPANELLTLSHFTSLGTFLIEHHGIHKHRYFIRIHLDVCLGQIGVRISLDNRIILFNYCHRHPTLKLHYH